MRKVALIIPAAGLGTRMKSRVRKPFLEIGGRPILHATLERFRDFPEIAQVILAVTGEEFGRRDAILAETRELGVTDVVEGGATRTLSVANALAALAKGIDIVLIHDAVRPFVRREVIAGVIEAAGKTGAAIAGAPVKDTIKRVEGREIRATVAREGLYLAQTPQGFRRGTIVEAYARREGDEYSDDALLVEAAGGKVAVVESTFDNFKITTPEDLRIAEAMCRML